MADVMLAEKWADEDPSGWWISEKLDGVRAVWKGGEFVSRGDNSFVCPEWFAKQMPKGCVLDGELWGGRRQFQKTVGIVKSASRAKEWEFLTYMVFDCTAEDGKPIEHRPFEDRLAAIDRICATGTNVLKPVPMKKCLGRDHLQELLTEIESRGGEGLMLRRPGSLYERRRSKALLKVKTFHDEEAVIVGHETGKGRLATMCGALLCETPDKRRFKVGSGLNDAQRSNPPKVGTVITYRFQELTNANIPRFPTLAGERVDLSWRTICATYVPPGKKVETALQKKHSVLFGDGLASGTASSSPTVAASSAATSAQPLKRKLSGEDIAQRAVPVEDLEDFAADEATVPLAKRPRTTTVDKRTVCIYGSKCYRSSPEHFAEYAHPWLDEENDAPAVVAPDVGSSSSAAAAPPSAASAPLAAVALAPSVVAVPRPAILAAAAPAATTAMAGTDHTTDRQQIAGAADTRDVRINALRSLLASLAKDAAEHLERSHFQHMLDILDAGPSVTEPDRLAHLTKKVAEPPPPFPPPDDPPPASMISSMRSPTPVSASVAPSPESKREIMRPPAPSSASAPPRSVASALMSLSSSTAVSEPALPPSDVPASSSSIFRADTVVASPEEIAKAVAASEPTRTTPLSEWQHMIPKLTAAHGGVPPVVDVDLASADTSAADTAATAADAHVVQIMDLGFSAADSAEALKRNSDVQTAIEWLLSR